MSGFPTSSIIDYYYSGLPSDGSSSSKKVSCQICGDEESARHYGVNACSGCKSFFRRTILNQTFYTCSHYKKCNVDKVSRNLCKACRFEKCMQIGMQPSLVVGPRKKKVPDQSLDYPSKMGKHDYQVAVKSPDYANLNFEVENILIASKYLTRDRTLPLGFLDIIPKFDSDDFWSISKYYVLVERVCDGYFETPLTHLCKEFDSKCSLEVPQSVAVKEPGRLCHRSRIGWDAKFMVTSAQFRNIWCRAVTIYFDWASHIPELQKLNDDDKVALIIGRLTSTIGLNMGYKSAQQGFLGVVFSGGAYFPGKPDEEEFLDKDLKLINGNSCKLIVKDFVVPCLEMKLTEAEFTLLKVIIFLSPIPGLSPEGLKTVEESREKYITALSNLIHSSYPKMTVLEKINRIGRIMMFVGVIEKVAELQDAGMSLMTLFNIANVRGTLSYDAHIRKYKTLPYRADKKEEK